MRERATTQRKKDAAERDKTPAPHHPLDRPTPGQPLEPATRAFFEPRLGHAFGDVQIHAGAAADALAREFEARAFTVGSDIYFRSGAYDPSSPGGLHLLAHELAHTAQQAAGPVSGTEGPGGVRVSDPSDSFEQAAERAADAALLGLPAPMPAAMGAPAGTVQRWPEWLDKALGYLGFGGGGGAPAPGGPAPAGPVAAPSPAPPQVINMPPMTIYGDAGAGGFDLLAEGGVKAGQAPKNITLPESMQKGLKDAWGKSFPDDKSHEQGGILVQDENGEYVWKAGPASAGTSGTFQPNRGDVGAKEKLVATAHTHPYDKGEGGHTDVPFSSADMANMIFNPEQLKVVQSGEGQFALSRSAEFDKMIADLDDEGKNKMYEEMKAEWDKVFAATKGTLSERAQAAAKATAAKYKMPYYAGKGGKLTKQ